PGEHVNKGELILQLDKTKIQDEITHLNNQLLQKRNTLEKNRLNVKSSRFDLVQGEETRKSRILQLKSSLEQQQKLLEAGGTSETRVEQLKQNIVMAENDLNNQAEKNDLRLKQLEMDGQNLELQIRAYEKSLREQNEMLQKTDVKAPVSGILLEIAGNVGEYASLDQALIKVEDEDSYKIIGTAGKNKTSLIRPGGNVEVGVNDQKIQGTIGQVAFTEDSTSIQFDVFVAEDEQHKLEGLTDINMLVLANDKENVLRVRKLPGMSISKHMDVLLKKGKETVRTEIVIGAIGKDYCEIISGAEEGDEILIKDPASRKLL
ncbi:MAG TPA: HlyD family efflux transporter periplasmic adaptor subunit, partial [Draconibacterium sp.]|nr:HlyD family efflux transporter periplasmic adaptor subunit [Draconibacterium sp.]